MRTFPLHEYFYYTRLERNAGIVLCGLCVLAFSFPLFNPLLCTRTGKNDFSASLNWAASLVPSEENKPTEEGFVAFRGGRENTSPHQIESFNFDPNTVSKEDLVRLGLSARTAQTLLNFRAKGGHFYKKEDLKKVYGLREEDYGRLLPFIQIELPRNEKNYVESSKNSDNQDFTKPVAYETSRPEPAKFPKKNTAVMVDINAASVEDWQQIRGVGPGWAKRIVNYREKLGGFASAAQVGETHGLPDSVFQKIQPQIKVESPVFRRINLNAATLDELKKHPYLNSYQATILFNYRIQHGSYSDFASVKKVKVGFTDEDWRKLEPYFSFE
ncbi:MAG: hypothetical protein GC192_22705 [Bacteroidetes bacterium]|nr:hypothetical protein [Bacteroidota bacterium]